MYIFLDESGTHNPNGRSIIALIYTPLDTLERLNCEVIKAEKYIGPEPFHWARNMWANKEKFITLLSLLNFNIKIAFIQNPFSDKHYGLALQSLITEKDVHAIIIDGKKGKSYDKALKKLLRDKGISVNKIKTSNNAAHPGLRVADAIAGLVRYKNDNPTDTRAQKLYQKISKQIIVTIENSP